jgi:hypothetical protein
MVMKENGRLNTELVGDGKLLSNFFADLHIHIGSAQGKAVKITASRQLEIRTIIYRDAPRKLKKISEGK